LGLSSTLFLATRPSHRGGINTSHQIEDLSTFQIVAASTTPSISYTIFSMKIFALLVAVAISTVSSQNTKSNDPCDYCNPQPCSAPPERLWVCCNDGEYHACSRGLIRALGPKNPQTKGCKSGKSFTCLNPPDCIVEFEFLPFSQGGA